MNVKPTKAMMQTEAKKKVSNNEQIKELEDSLSKTKYNKRTQHHFGLVKAKIARLKEAGEQRKKGGPKFDGFAVKKNGDASVVLVGFPSVGKSTLLNSLTNANSKVAAYEFTTLDVVPGLMEYKGAKIQILDVPGILKGAAAGTGRGKEVISIMRNADLLLVIIEASNLKQLDVLKKEIYDANIRINQKKPDVKIVKTTKGGIDLGTTVKMNHLDRETIVDMLKEFKIINAAIVIREDIDADQLIDIVEPNRVYAPAAVVVNKMDIVSESELKRIESEIHPDLFISGESRINIDKLKDLIYDKLTFMRVYTKEVRKEADMTEPLIMRKGATIGDVCRKLHKDFVNKFKFARVWGSSKFPGQDIRKLEYILKDNDILEIHLK
ncbi:MAG: GTP-binding protein [Candidatus Woesearchaeota archaeon]